MVVATRCACKPPAAWLSPEAAPTRPGFQNSSIPVGPGVPGGTWGCLATGLELAQGQAALLSCLLGLLPVRHGDVQLVLALIYFCFLLPCVLPADPAMPV